MLKQVVFYGLSARQVSFSEGELNELKSHKIFLKKKDLKRKEVILRVINTQYPQNFQDKLICRQIEPLVTRVEFR
jgi:hypothetical protein